MAQPSTVPWAPPPDPLDLGAGEVHLWRAPLEIDAGVLEKLRMTLSAEEKVRAERFRFPEGRRRFTAARGILRDVLSRYTGRTPAALEFGYHASGKPYVMGTAGPGEPEFNLSHSKEMALYAVTRARRVGVDVEHIRSHTDCDRIAERFYAAREAEALRDLPPEERGEAFFRCWTRKEAYLKARGGGLALGLSSFEVSIGAGDSDALICVRDDPAAGHRWQLANVEIGMGYAGAVAVEQRGLLLRFWDWPWLP